MTKKNKNDEVMMAEPQTDTIQQNSTELVVVDKQTGLTPIQEQVAILLASGSTITEAAELVKVNRGTIYNWQKLITFKCFFNQQCAYNKANLESGLFGLADDALNAIRECLNNGNTSERFKAAIWVADKLANKRIGQTDVVEVIKKQCTYSPTGWTSDEVLDEQEFKSTLKGLGIELNQDQIN